MQCNVYEKTKNFIGFPNNMWDNFWSPENEISNSISLADEIPSRVHAILNKGMSKNHRSTSLKSCNSITYTSNLDETMQDFKLNGIDSPLNSSSSDQYSIWDTEKNKMNRISPGGLMRQMSWPDPFNTPQEPLPKHIAKSVPVRNFHSIWSTESPETGNFAYDPQEITENSTFSGKSTVSDQVTIEQLRVLSTMPKDVLDGLLRDLGYTRTNMAPMKSTYQRNKYMCRFCKNNGELEKYYMSHILKDDIGTILCPVLRAFICTRCGATGDNAHTIKYCPLSTEAERSQSTLMKKSKRLASGRRRRRLAPSSPDQINPFNMLNYLNTINLNYLNY